METNSHWTKNELVAYVLLFTAHSNYNESQKEKDLILSKVDAKTYERIHEEFDKDNDYQSIQKILQSLEENHYSTSDLELLFFDIKAMFLLDGEFDILERNMFLYLKKVLS